MGCGDNWEVTSEGSLNLSQRGWINGEKHARLDDLPHDQSGLRGSAKAGTGRCEVNRADPQLDL